MIRNWGIFALVFLMIGVPVSLASGGAAGAAASSRIAVIRSLSGDVQVQKAGGAKTFKAFAKLSLNQGDKLMTGSDGAAELQFANGTSEDDLLSVGGQSTITFSKLSDKKGTVTRVSMLKGTAWVDVKSIKSKDDDFRLETPTAVMGVRGTAFYAAVHPDSGATTTAVLSGVVQFAKTGSASARAAALNLYPTQETIALPDGESADADLVMLLNIGELVRGMPPAVIGSLLRSKSKIDDENRELAARFAQDKLPSSLGATPEDLARFERNAFDLTGVFAKQAIEQKKLDLAEIQRIEREQGTTFSLDKTELQWTEADKQKQEAARQREAASAARQAEDAAAKLKALQERLADRLQAIEQAKQAQLAANKEAAAEAQAKAEAALQSQMTDAQKAQFQMDKAANQASAPVPAATPAATPTATTAATPTPTPTPVATPTAAPTATPVETPTPSSEARLASLEVNGATLNAAFSPSRLSYAAVVNAGVAGITVRPVAVDSAATISVNGEPTDGGAKSVRLEYGSNTIDIRVTSPDGSLARDYIVTITRELLDVADVAIGAAHVQIDFASGSLSTPISVPGDIDSIDLTLRAEEAPIIRVNGTAVPASPETTSPANDAWRYTLPLQTGYNTIAVAAEAGGKSKTYTLYANRQSLNSGLSGLTVKSADGQREFGASLGQDGKFRTTIPTLMTEGQLVFWPSDSRSTMILNGASYAYGQAAPISLASNVAEIGLTIRSESGTTTDYTLALDRFPIGGGTDATLSGIKLMNGSLQTGLLTPDSNLRLALDVPATRSSVEFQPTFSESERFWRYIRVRLAGSTQDLYPDMQTSNYTIPLNATGETAVEIVIQSADKSATNTYTFIVGKKILGEAVRYDAVAGQTLTGQLEGSDPAGLPLTYALVPGSGPAFGSLTVNPDGSFQYQAAAGALGTDAFDYTVSNGTDISAPSTVTIFVQLPAPALIGLEAWNLATNGTPVNPYYLGESAQASNTFEYAKYLEGMPSAIDLTYRFDSSVQSASLIYDDNQNTPHNVDLLAAAGAATLTNLKYGENRIKIVYVRENGDSTSTTYTVQWRLYTTLSLYTPRGIANGATVPVFGAGLTAYTASVPANADRIRLQLETADPYSTFEVESNGTPVADDGSGYLVNLSGGWNRVTVRLNRLGLGADYDDYKIDIYRGDEVPEGYALRLTAQAVPGDAGISFAPDASRSTLLSGHAPAGSTEIMLAPVAELSDTYIGGVYLVKNGWWEWVNATAQGSGIYRIPLDGGSAHVYVLVNKYGRPPMVYEADITP
ncbi:cadherin-like beta sandwich domain-containing protein [Cohnella sp. GbtcB17]|uniref:cadherin-like beta sandwich domain-containing protein n=1 Tax=Cohnella sp. GbtcB17 TaxID=2824762 RepID=UPI001C2F4233|nr:cadherin-like beta sandwich domain-containing protein [Cohnella sp. GbtcB17]